MHAVSLLEHSNGIGVLASFKLADPCCVTACMLTLRHNVSCLIVTSRPEHYIVEIYAHSGHQRKSPFVNVSNVAVCQAGFQLASKSF